MDESTTRFGIIGTGRITRRLVAELQSTENVTVTAIASRTAERSQWFADQYGIGVAVEGYDQLLARDDVDAVYISLPPSLHAEWSIAAAVAGKHVLCEKPLAMNAAEAITVRDACADVGVRWLDATGWLHHERTDRFRELLDSGELGVIGHISAAVSFYAPFQSGEHRLDPALGGGCVLDLAWYAGGLTYFAAGQLPETVIAKATLRDGVPYRATALLTFAGGVSATVSCGFDTATRKWFEVAGSDASLVCDDFTRSWADKPTRFWIHEASGVVKSETIESAQERRMISRLVGSEDLTRFHNQAIATHHVLDAINRSILTEAEVTLEAVDSKQCN